MCILAQAGYPRYKQSHLTGDILFRGSKIIAEDVESDSDEYDLSPKLLREMETSRFFILERATSYLFLKQFGTDPWSCHVG